MIYTYLYEKNDINKFINESSKTIVSKGVISENLFRKYEEKYKEFNINIYKIPDNAESFFGKDLQNNISALLEFFNPEIIKTKFTYKDNKKIEIDEEKIVIDDLEFNNNKINLFSTEFLIMNGLKSKINESDFEIYNNGNYSVYIFSKFLEKIILEINNIINNTNSENDFIKNRLIKLHKKRYSHFISAKLDYIDNN